LNDEVAKCEVLLAVIGRNWLDARDEHGNRRLDDPNDFVVIEIKAALQRDIPVVPILVEGARIPNPNQLPKELEELSVRNALNVHHSSFHSDVDRLVKGVQALLNVHPPSPQLKTEDRAKDAKAAITSKAEGDIKPVGSQIHTFVSRPIETEPPPQTQEVQPTAPQERSSSQIRTIISRLIEAFPTDRRFKTPFRWSLIIAGVIGGVLPLGVVFVSIALFGHPAAGTSGFPISVLTWCGFSGGVAGLLRVKLTVWQSTIVFFVLCFLVTSLVLVYWNEPNFAPTAAYITAVSALTTWIALLLEERKYGTHS
jgi:hypothetical protein